MAEAQDKSKFGIWALVVAGGAIAFFLMQKRDSNVPAAPPAPAVQAPAEQPTEPEPPIKLGSIGVPVVRDYFTTNGYTFEDKPLPNNVPRIIGTSSDGKTQLEFVGPATLAQATLRYTLREGNLNGGDLHAIMHLTQHVKASEADLAWAMDAARKGEPTTRTIAAIVVSIQRGPNGTTEFVMRPAPGFE